MGDFILALMIALMIVGLFVVVDQANDNLDDMAVSCEEKGGVFLHGRPKSYCVKGIEVIEEY